ncbi:MAG TPA: hypothetical protein VML55_08230 [Planctomycetaceae bacterium]|nr:hypothetical protein [Planctomycetaceae bacterium]
MSNLIAHLLDPCRTLHEILEDTEIHILSVPLSVEANRERAQVLEREFGRDNLSHSLVLLKERAHEALDRVLKKRERHGHVANVDEERVWDSVLHESTHLYPLLLRIVSRDYGSPAQAGYLLK